MMQAMKMGVAKSLAAAALAMACAGAANACEGVVALVGKPDYAPEIAKVSGAYERWRAAEGSAKQEASKELDAARSEVAKKQAAWMAKAKRACGEDSAQSR